MVHALCHSAVTALKNPVRDAMTAIWSTVTDAAIPAKSKRPALRRNAETELKRAANNAMTATAEAGMDAAAIVKQRLFAETASKRAANNAMTVTVEIMTVAAEAASLRVPEGGKKKH